MKTLTLITFTVVLFMTACTTTGSGNSETPINDKASAADLDSQPDQIASESVDIKNSVEERTLYVDELTNRYFYKDETTGNTFWEDGLPRTTLGN